MREVFLIRHGEARAGGSKMDCDFSLTPLGVQQANSCGRRLAQLGVRPDVIYASRLRRAFQTAEIIRQHTPAPLVQREDLIEHGSAVLLLDCSPEEAARRRPECLLSDGALRVVQGQRDGLNWDFSIAGEDMRALHARAAGAWNSILQAHGQEGAVIIVVSHGSFLSAMVSEVLGMPLRPVWGLQLANAAFLHLRVYPDPSDGRPLPSLVMHTPDSTVAETHVRSEKLASGE